VTAPAMTTPAWLADAESEERAELASVGIVLDAPEIGFPDAASDRDAAMSMILRQLGRAALDMERYTAAAAREHEAITARYARITDPLSERAAWLASLGRQLALETPMEGKAKTRHVAYGDFGTRKVPARVSIERAPELLAWAKLAAPELVDVKIEKTERVLQKAAAGYFTETGDLPAGCKYEPEHEDPILKPDLELLRSL
jgi:phage host-nuclease inhibitor protein Gam